MKTAIDTVCDWIVPGLRPGFADSDPKIQIKVDQKKGNPKQYALEISFESL